jgi:hypothetical protein
MMSIFQFFIDAIDKKKNKMVDNMTFVQIHFPYNWMVGNMNKMVP